MVSLWPWKAGEDAASFEKTLSALSTKISKTTAKNDNLRQTSRRIRVMWTLYAGFAYILAALLLLLVTGWQSWGATEISIVAGGPVVIYLVRTALSKIYEYRIKNTQLSLDSLYKQRDATIERLKTATKYNSTQQLLEKYGSSPKAKEAPSPSNQRRKAQGPQKQTQPQGPRTNIPPPPTANIQRPGGSPPVTPQRPVSAAGSPQGPAPPQQLLPPDAPGAEFAPNAYGPGEVTRQYSASAASTFTQHHWYDRILDALLGEDETQAKNRLALICSECRLVNGQAPPGTRTLEDVGRWRCGGCGAWNGKEKTKEDTIAGLVQDWEEERKAREKEETEDGPEEVNTKEIDEGSGMDIVESVEEDQTPAKSTRSRKGKGKK